jgi:hypothetical protein
VLDVCNKASIWNITNKLEVVSGRSMTLIGFVISPFSSRVIFSFVIVVSHFVHVCRSNHLLISIRSIVPLIPSDVHMTHERPLNNRFRMNFVLSFS